MGKTLPKHIILYVAIALSLCGQFYCAYFLKRQSTVELFGVFAILFAAYYFICRQQLTTRQFTLVIGSAIVLRLIWLFAFPQLSDDYARFVWDGRLSVAGYNPMKYTPAEIMKLGRPAICIDPTLYTALNSQSYYTCYPPLLQFIFMIAAGLFPHSILGSIVVMRVFNMAADIGSVFLLISLCKKWKINERSALLYALNPIVIAELTGNLHFEGIMIFCLLAEVYFIGSGKFWMAVIMFTLSVITKLVPLMLLPLMFYYVKGKKGFLFCCCVVVFSVVSFLPFIDASVAEKFWSSIDSYFQESEYNASIYYAVRDTIYHFTGENNIEIIGPVLTALSGLLILTYAFVKRNKMNALLLLKYFSFTFLIYYAFTTTVFPWYLAPMILCSVLTGYKFPLVWSGMIVLSYYADRTDAFIESYPLIWVEYITVGAAVVWDIYKERKSRLLVFSN